MGIGIALFGQAAFGRDVLVRLQDDGHDIVAAYVPPDGSRPDPMAAEAAERGLPLIRHKYFRRKGQAIPDRVDEHRAVGADLNVLAFVTAILPPEIVDGPPHGSLCFHPSLLPRFRGGNALAWQIIQGEKESGVTVFRPDDGVDTGPIVVQRGGVPIRDDDTAATLYFDRLYPLGVDAIALAVSRVADGTAQYAPQDDTRASHQGLVDDIAARIDWRRNVGEIDRLIRGCDPQPGAHATREGEVVRLFAGRLAAGAASEPPGTVVAIEDGRLLIDARGGRLSVGKVKIGDGKKVAVVESGLAPGDRLT
ncbi:MAG: methionyl-tRNA formyltransferase [Myxococcota bacterium]